MRIQLTSLVATLGIAAFGIAALSSPVAASASAIPATHAVAVAPPALSNHIEGTSGKCGSPSAPCTCTGVLSVMELSPAVAYVTSGQFTVLSTTTATAAACAHKAVQTYLQQLTSGWDKTATCSRANSPTDTLMVYMTYVWSTNPSTRVDGWATICSPTTPVANVNPL